MSSLFLLLVPILLTSLLIFLIIISMILPPFYDNYVILKAGRSMATAVTDAVGHGDGLFGYLRECVLNSMYPLNLTPLTLLTPPV
jgi:hypothetical protein